MSTAFTIRHQFRSPSIDLYWRGYFDDDHVVRLDALTGVTTRQVLERADSESSLYRSVRLTPARQLPRFLRALTDADLSYVENSIFHRAQSRMDIEILPSLLPERTKICGSLAVESGEQGHVVRVFSGEIEVRLPVVGARIERLVLQDMLKSYEIAVVSTQQWLDANA